jgi:glycosyltransferase involved in cell wall biosynthesis/peptidoglycan/xylan/chitin deacetylase (PgdA/CDA1 family)
MTNFSPKVSVIIPCYNLGAYLDQAVQSVLDQTYKDFEIIIIDDGSTDQVTRNLFTSYQRPYTRIFRTRNQGVMEARNLGIKESKGRYLSFLDADDILEPVFLEKTVSVLESDPGVAFASCWLRAFGAAEFLWNPASCDFPHLLAEDTVCTAALTNKEAILAVGSFDTEMPLAGYEDWELAINLVKHGFQGKIIPEYLFRYRIRHDSLSQKATEPKNHLRLMRYIVEKHPESYKSQLKGVLNTIEKRTIELERSVRETHHSDNTYLIQQRTFLNNTINAVLKSRSWRITKPLRHGYRLMKLMHEKIINPKVSTPRLSVIITCFNHEIELHSIIDSLRNQSLPESEIIIVDQGSSNPVTLQMLDWFKETGIKIITTNGAEQTQAREIGLRQASAPIIFAMDCGQLAEPSLFTRAIKILDENHDVSFILFGSHDNKTGFNWIPDSAELPGILPCPRVNFPFIRRDTFLQAGSYDINLNNTAQADWELTIRLLEQGYRGILLVETLIKGNSSGDDKGMNHRSEYGSQPIIEPVVKKHLESFDIYWKESILGLENKRRLLQAQIEKINSPNQNISTGSEINWGSLRRVEPISDVWGVDRGKPVDRYYIESFLNHYKNDIGGRVLEVKDPVYTKAYGQKVEKFDVVDIAPENPLATITCDLGVEKSLPECAYDCFILIQTIHIIYDIQNVVENIKRTLAPGGVVLATLPCLSRIDYESGKDGDFWRFTTASARKLFEDAFGEGNVEIQAVGNVLTCCAFLMGLSAGELRPDELNYHDPYFPLLICVRAVKPKNNVIATKSAKTSENQKAIILLYHRIEHVTRDRWNLCVTPENFSEHIRFLKRHFIPVSLSELACQLEDGKIGDKSAVITFDDGYLDNFTKALPILRKFDFPATFFISGDGALYGKTFWWESLDASALLMDLDEETVRNLHHRLMSSDIDEREKILASLHPPINNLPDRMRGIDLKKLSQDRLAEIAAHGWSHRALSALSIEEQRMELMENIKAIRNTTDSDVHSFSYPFGGFFTDDTKRLLSEAGIRVACIIGAEPVTKESDPLALPRLDVENWDIREFENQIWTFLNG